MEHTAVDIETLIQIYYMGHACRSTPASDSAIERWKHLNMIQDALEESFNDYELTKRGTTFIEHIKNLPLPEMNWKMP